MTRQEALEAIAQNVYTPQQLQEDKEYVIKKLDFTESEFNAMMESPVKSHNDYASDEALFNVLNRLAIFLKLSRN